MPALKTQASSSSRTQSDPVRYLKGVGPEKERLLARLGIHTLNDLWTHFPRRHEKRFPVISPDKVTGSGKECVLGRITGRSIFRYGGMPVFKAVIQGNKRAVRAVYYHQPYMLQIFKPGHFAVLYGATEKKGRQFQMVHPEYEIFEGPDPQPTAHHGRWVPVYPLTEELTQKSLRSILWQALETHPPAAEDPLPASVRKRQGLCDRSTALRHIHFPEDKQQLIDAHRRLVFEEFFDLQLFLEKRRRALKKERPALVHDGTRGDLGLFYSSLPFVPTRAQRKAVQEIIADLSKASPMNRLLQGDVGSGKTLVAAAALYFMIKNGYQGALMAPTEILAKQLFGRMTQFLEPHGIVVGYVAAGADPAFGVERDIAEGRVDVAVGTHALLEDKVRFRNLGLVIVDEQHKFGVDQRTALARKQGGRAHALAMTATPIPRTLALTLYGDMDVSVLDEKPRDRALVRTLCFRTSERNAVYRWMDSLMGEGAQVFVVCAWLDSEKAKEGQSAKQMAAALQTTFPNRRVGLLHGRMSSTEKTKVMNGFRDRSFDVLVSTVIVEVGVDVPSARVMVVENAEQFGLAQLHQLRGRVGRSSEDAFCFLFSDTSEEGYERLERFAETDSGFDIAEQDLERRGAGEFHGKRQHGQVVFKIADPARDHALMVCAKEEAKRFLDR